MIERPDSLFPVVWACRGDATGGENLVAGQGFETCLAAVWAQVLRYGGPGDVVLLVRTASSGDWNEIALPALPDPMTMSHHRAVIAAKLAELSMSDCLVCDVAVGGEDPDRLMFRFTFDESRGWAVRLHSTAQPASPRALDRIGEHTAAFAAAADHELLPNVVHVTAAERELLRRVNATAGARPEVAGLHQLVERAARRHPDALAVVHGPDRLTFAELDAKAEALAGAIIDAGVGRGDRVGVLAARGARFAVSALAVLKAGAAYVPLDPLLPPERLTRLEAIASVRLLLVEQGQEHLAANVNAPHLVVAPVAELPAGRRDLPEVRGDDLAYVVFTSGSTGEPKGVMVRHEGVTANVTDLTGRLGITAADRVLSVASPTFDISVFDMIGVLSVGGSVWFPDVGKEYDLDHWVELAAAARATIWHSVPSTLVLFLNTAAGRQPGDFRHFMLTGDRIPMGLPASVREQYPSARVHSFGGATEASIYSIIFDTTEVRPQWRNIPYGVPMTNQALYIVDAWGALTGVDQVGELLITGIGVTDGYLGRPDLTAERFVPCTFDDVPGDQAYRTGDLARLRPDGVVDLVGRMDQQLKVNGVRIEPGEIEARLRACEEISEGVVVARRNSHGAAVGLVAWVVPSGSGEVDLVTAVRAQLAAELPSTMVPGEIRVLDELPLNPNGKIDRRMLELRVDEPATVQVNAVDRDGIIGEVAAIWADVLALPDLPAPADSFLHLGGGSLAVMQVVNRLRQRFDVSLSVAQVFAASTVADVARLVGSAGSSPEEPDLQENAAAEHPLSSGQRRLWFLDQLGTSGAAYHVPFAMRIDGDLDVAALRSALEKVLDDHTILRTVYRENDGDVVQVVRPLEDFAPVLDIRTCAEEQVDEQIASAVAAQFDLGKDLPLRARLFRLTGGGAVLLLVVHHIAFDGPSTLVLAEALTAAYEPADSTGERDVPQYAGFVARELEWVGQTELDRQLRFWRRELRGVEPLRLPTDRPRPRQRSGLGDEISFTVPAVAAEAMRALAADHGATLFMAGLAVFQVLLARWTGQQAPVVGVPVSTRSAQDERLIGFAINSLVLRGDLTGDPTVAEVLERTRDTMLSARDHQDLPFELLVADLVPDRDPSRNALFQVQFVADTDPRDVPWTLPGLTVTPWLVGLRASTVDLSVFFAERPDGALGMRIVYSTELFDRATVLAMAGHYQNLFTEMTARSSTPVRALEMLGASERDELLGRQGPVIDYPADACVHQLVAEQAVARPDAVAVACGDHRLTYRELDEQSNQLAWRLRDSGVGPESVVGILLGRGVPVLVAMLGVLKAGGAYLVLDAEYPDERLAFLVADSGMRVVLTDEEFAGRTRALPVEPIDVENRDDLGSRPVTTPDTGVSASNLAYVIYTSGSTGTPKGVLVTHSNLVHFLASASSAFPPGGDRGSILYTSLAFDLPVPSVFLPLVQGQDVVVVTGSGAESVEDLVRLLARGERFSTIKITPTHLRMLLAAIEGSEVNGDVRIDAATLVVAGEPFPVALAEKVRAVCTPATAIVNEYGPTETTVGATVWPVAPTATDPGSAGNAVLPIGLPMPNVDAYVVDSAGALAPVGVIGELWVGGPGVARGYLNRPELTAERFVTREIGGRPCRVYRTGDLVRRRHGGEIEFIGRVDDQVKLRGFRVEPSEVESALLAHPAVTAAAVTVHEFEPGDQRLVAYCVVSADVTSATLQQWCAMRLPRYLMPSLVQLVDALPLTPSGKVDRGALPAPDPRGRELADRSVAPRTGFEELVAQVWADVLGVDRVGVHDDFFVLGGHSMLATRAANRLATALGREVSVRDVFDFPTVAGHAARIGRREDGLAELKPRPDRDVPAPLSFAQQRLWFLEQLAPDRAEYLSPRAMRLRGRLDAEALGRAIDGLAARHDALRTRFVRGPQGDPVQEVVPIAGPHLRVVDVSGGIDPEASAMGVLHEEVRRPFDLSVAPLFRVVLLRLADTDHVLVLVLHHIVSDGWSVGVLMTELKTLYEGGDLPEHSLSYLDFAVWQREALLGGIADVQLEHWRCVLDGLVPVELPGDRPRPRVRSGRGGVLDLLIGDVAGGVRELARRTGTTPFMVLLAVFDVVLSRWSGSADIAVGTPIANRTKAEIEGIVGFFANTLVLRVDTSGEPSFAQLLHRVRDVCLAAYANQDVPFERIVEELAPERDLSRTPLFQVMFILQNASSERWSLSGVDVDEFTVDPGVAKFDLTMFVRELGDDLEVSIEYSSDLFDATTVDRLAGHFRTLLAAFVEDPDSPVRTTEMLTAAELDELRAWNGTRTDHIGPLTVHALVEEQAAVRPGAVAVVHGERSLTYGELNERANRLAHHLRALGVAPDVPVGLCLERCPDLIVGILAVLKAGGAYVPLDPDHPADRLGFVLSDTGAPVVVTTRRTLDRLPAGADRVTVLLDSDRVSIDGHPGVNPEFDVEGKHLACVFYTSGSSGRAKGALIEHQAICRRNRTNWYGGVTPDDVVAQTASMSFDILSFECWGALAHGARLVLVDADDVLEAERLREVVRANGVSIMWLTAGLFNQHLVRCPDLLDGMKTVEYGGEAVERSVADAVVASEWAPRNLINGYGPTENWGNSSWHVVRTDSPRTPFMPIGKVVANAEAFVVDEAGALAPVGVPGELWISGAGVARGYLNRPELTAERFVVREFDGQMRRCYRTGDLVRWLPGGELEFVGRTDDQVKVRGYRIEPGEIEAVLMANPAVSGCVVVAREDQRSERYLAAYCVRATGADAGAEALRAWCARTLPAQMIPSAFVFLDALPLTSRGKIDRAALPDPDSGRPDLLQGFTPPRTEIEGVVASVWADVLGLCGVGVHDDFFALGGHSMTATRVVNRLSDLLGVAVSVRLLFDRPTVAGMAESLVPDEQQAAARMPVVPRPDGAEALLSFGQQRVWFLDQFTPQSLEYTIPYALRLRGQLDVAALRRAIGELVQRHESLRTVVADADGVAVQRVLPSPGEPLVVEDLPGATEREAVVAVEAHLRAPMDLRRGPLFRAVLVRISPTEHLLGLVLHHIIADGWSVGVLMRELRELYAGRELPPLTISYGDFAMWQRETLCGGMVDAQLCHWRDVLADLAPLDLPGDRPRPAVRSGGGDVVEFSTGGVRELARRTGTTPFMVLLAVFDVVLSRWSGSVDIAVGTPIANRTKAEIEGIVGFFLNTLVLRVDVSGDPTFTELLARVRQVSLAAYANQDVPFERVVEELAPARDLSRTPLFQVMFMLQNASDERWRLPGVEVEEFRIDAHESKFDLTMSVRERGDDLDVVIEYSTDLFDAATVERLGGHFRMLLRAFSADPEARVSAAQMLTAAELDFVRVWNDTAVDHLGPSTVPEAVALRAAAAPDAPAVVFGARTLTYRELNERANQLAHHLRSFGVGAGTPVGTLLRRGPELVVTLLAVLRSGGAYVPLDPGHPAERLEFMLRDTAAPIVVTTSGLATVPGAPRVVRLDLDQHEIAALPRSAPDTQPQGDDIAYVIYTSGSTGVPKGVAVPHTALTNLIESMANRFPMGPGHTFLATTTVMFDIAALEIFLPLARGARLAVGEAGLGAQPADFAGAIERYQANYCQATPSVWRILLDEDARAVDGVHILVGGEALPVDLATRLVRGAASVTNLYGPTETTIWSLAWPVPDVPSAVFIGRPIANTEAFVLDAAGVPMPPGAIGELWIAGAGVALGYWNRPELTAERFRDIRVDGLPRRMYRTGDLVRLHLNGDMEYLGRQDLQVKLHGHRIELGEIEARIAAHPAVTACAAAVREDPLDAKRLVAYCVTTSPVATEELRHWCAETLPVSMVPGKFVFLNALPLTANGKLDRKALPVPETVRTGGDESFIGPRDTVEQVITRVWGDVLAVDRIGVHDNFFELGGDSILSVQVVVRGRLYGLDLAPRMMFQHSTVAELAARVAESLDTPPGATAVLTPWQRCVLGLVRSDMRQARSVLLRLDEISTRDLGKALSAVTAHHPALMIRLSLVDGWWYPILDAELSGPLIREHRPASSAEIAAIARDARGRAAPGSGDRLLQADLAEVGPGERYLLLTANDVMLDHASWDVLLTDLSIAVASALAGRDVVLPLPTAPVSAWDLSDASPVRVPDVSADTHSVGALSVELAPEQTDALFDRVLDELQVRIDHVVAAATAHAVGELANRVTGIDLEADAREHVPIDLARTTGCLRLHLHVEPSAGLDPLAALAEVGARASDGVLDLGRALPRRGAVRVSYRGPDSDAVPGLGVRVRTGELAAAIGTGGGTLTGELDVHAQLRGGRLVADITWSPEAHDENSVTRFAGALIGWIERLVSLARDSSLVPTLEADRFPLSGLDQTGLSALLERLAE
jgi:amino acid adenylation domain-containing protein